MSTRCNVIIKDTGSQLIFYRHSDGYPSGVKPTLTHFLELVKSDKIRNNASQAAGWLIMIGNVEYDAGQMPNPEDRLSGWKVWAYEPTDKLHGDIEYLYEIDLTAQTLKGWEWDMNKHKKGAEVNFDEEEEAA